MSEDNPILCLDYAEDVGVHLVDDAGGACDLWLSGELGRSEAAARLSSKHPANPDGQP